MRYIIGEELKKSRLKANLSVGDIVSFLCDNGEVVSSKTIYGWENNAAYPSVYVFLLLCQKYGINNVVETFLTEKDSTT